MKGACCGRINTNRHTPTSCSEASRTYLWSLEMFFWSSAAQSFWFVVLIQKQKIRNNIGKKTSVFFLIYLAEFLNNKNLNKLVHIILILIHQTKALQLRKLRSNIARTDSDQVI